MDNILSHGAISTLLNGGDVEKPVLQILGVKRIDILPPGDNRYRLFLSDGVGASPSGLLNTQLNELIESGQLDQFAVFTVEKYSNPLLQDRRLVVISEISNLRPGIQFGAKIGQPQTIANGPPPRLQPNSNIVNQNVENGPVVVAATVPTPIESFSYIRHDPADAVIEDYTTLTSGAIHALLGGNVVAAPVLQLLAAKRLCLGSNDRYRLFLSDGIYCTTYVMLATSANHLLTDRVLDKFAIFRLDHFNNCQMDDRRILHIDKITVLKPGAEVNGKIGHPRTIGGYVAATPGPPPATPELSKGAIRILLSGGHFVHPVLQLMVILKCGDDQNLHHRAYLSDGTHICPFAVLDQNITPLITSEKLNLMSVIRLIKYTNVISSDNRRSLTISEVQIIAPGQIVRSRIGNPLFTENVSNLEPIPLLIPMPVVLSAGSVETLLGGGDFDMPVVQIMQIHRNGNSFFATISDGTEMTASAKIQLDIMAYVLLGCLHCGSVIRLNSFLVLMQHSTNSRILVLREISILSPCG